MIIEILSIIFAGISAVTAIVSLIFALRAKAEVARLDIKINGSDVNVGNKVSVSSSGSNSGTITGISNGK